MIDKKPTPPDFFGGVDFFIDDGGTFQEYRFIVYSPFQKVVEFIPLIF